MTGICAVYKQTYAFQRAMVYTVWGGWSANDCTYCLFLDNCNLCADEV